jgi:hypothetical protein
MIGVPVLMRKHEHSRFAPDLIHDDDNLVAARIIVAVLARVRVEGYVNEASAYAE